MQNGFMSEISKVGRGVDKGIHYHPTFYTMLRYSSSTNGITVDGTYYYSGIKYNHRN